MVFSVSLKLLAQFYFQKAASSGRWPLKIVLFTLFFLIKTDTFSQVFYDQHFRKVAAEGIYKTYNLEYEAADKIFLSLKTEYPQHPAPLFLLSLNRWWQSYISTTPAWHAYIEKSLGDCISLNQKMKDTPGYELEYTFFQYMGYAFLTRLYILRKEWLKAANTGRKALPYLSKSLEYTRKSPEFYFSAGIYHYYAEIFPARHPYIKPFAVLFPEGNAEQGLEELEYAAGNPNFTQAEALYYLGDIYLEEEGKYARALSIKKSLAAKYPGNTWFQMEYARALVHNQRYAEAEIELQRMQKAFESLRDYQKRHITSLESNYSSQVMFRAYHYLGRIALERDKQYNRALDFFRKSNDLARIAGIDMEIHLAANLYFSGRCYEGLKQYEKAREAYLKVLDMEENHLVKSKAEACLAGRCPVF
ncbi:MAG: tetratricopeptide repeat protein [Bacteroidia bacterium]|nr:tetratricopeptide repeat protein [Bacteroidia bacterium]